MTNEAGNASWWRITEAVRRTYRVAIVIAAFVAIGLAGTVPRGSAAEQRAAPNAFARWTEMDKSFQSLQHWLSICTTLIKFGIPDLHCRMPRNDLAAMDNRAAGSQMASEDLARGKELREALDSAYQKLSTAGALKTDLHGTNITQLVSCYIPIGTPFDAAEEILRQAGFAVGPRPGPTPPNDPNRSKDWYAEIARISPYANPFPARIDIYVSLFPETPGHYETVAKISAQIFLSMP